MALKKLKLMIMTTQAMRLSCELVHGSNMTVTESSVNEPASVYESFPEDPQDNSINELILYFKSNRELFEQYKDEKKDKGLPEWLYISEFFKRHNCFGSNCVKKAVENLEQLEKFYFTGMPAPSATPSGAVVPWTKAALEPAVQPAVIGEVLLLLANLHYDCVRTHEKLRREIDITEYITCQIDEMGEKKLKTIAAAVQREHNKFREKNLPCFMKDQYMQRIYGICKKKMVIAQNYNTLLNEDIEYSTAQIPLVEEKMKLEQVNIDKICAAFEESKATLAETLKRLEVAKKHHMEAKRLTDMERNDIKNNITGMYEELERLRKSVKTSAENDEQMKKDIIETKQKIRENEEIKTVYDVKIDNFKSSLQILNMEYKELTQRLNAQLKTNSHLKKENMKLQKTLESKHTALKENITKLQTEQESLEKQLSQMESSNVAMVSQTKALDDEIETFQTYKSMTDKSVSRISYEILKRQTELVLAKDELKRYLDLNAHFRSSICLQEKHNLEKEKKLEDILETLKTKVTEENEKFDILSVEVEEANAHLEEVKKGYDEEKEKLLKHEQETIDIVNALDEKLIKLNYLKSQREKIVESLMQKKNNLQAKFNDRLQDDNAYLDKLTPYKEMLAENVFYLEKKETEIISMENTMKTQVKTMEQQKHAFSSVTVKLKGNIRKNRISMMNIKTQLQKIDDTSTDSLRRLKETQDRINQLYSQHKDLQAQRQKVLKDIIDQKQKHLKENADLASQYRWQQNHLIYLQYCFVEQTDKNLHLEEALNDLRQLLSMQWKVHQNLHNYFQYRGMFNTQKLQQLQHKSDLNQKKAHDLKRSIDNNIDSMSSYIDQEIAESIQRSVRIKEKRHLLPKITTPITG